MHSCVHVLQNIIKSNCLFAVRKFFACLDFTMLTCVQMFQLLILSWGVVTTVSQPTWTMEPPDIMALTGETVTLTCVVGNRTSPSRADQKLFWYQAEHAQRISRNMNVLVAGVDGSQFSVLFDRTLGTYTLVMTNVSQYHGGSYQCIYRDPISNVEYYSDLATLTVLVPPEGGYEQCKIYPQSKIILSPTRTRVLACEFPFPIEAEEGSLKLSKNKAVYHSWQEKNSMVLHGFFLQNRTTLLSESGVLSGNPVSVKFCAVNSLVVSSFPGFCRLVPIMKNVVAVIDPPSLVASAGEDISLRCGSNDDSIIVDHTWEFRGIFPYDEFSVHEKGSIITVKNVGYTNGQVKIVCHITTELGLRATAIANITTNFDVYQTNKLGNMHEGRTEEPAKISYEPTVKEIDPTDYMLKNISFLVGPGVGVLLLFVCAVFFACCFVKWRRKDKTEGYPAHVSQEAHAAVSLTAINQNNSTASKLRRYSDSVACRVSTGSESYENIEAYADKLGEFSRGTSSFQLNTIQPLEANFKLKIEMPHQQSLSTSLPALNMHAISPVTDTFHCLDTPGLSTLKSCRNSGIDKRTKSFNRTDTKVEGTYMPLSKIVIKRKPMTVPKPPKFGKIGRCY